LVLGLKLFEYSYTKSQWEDKFVGFVKAGNSNISFV